MRWSLSRHVFFSPLYVSCMYINNPMKRIQGAQLITFCVSNSLIISSLNNSSSALCCSCFLGENLKHDGWCSHFCNHSCYRHHCWFDHQRHLPILTVPPLRGCLVQWLSTGWQGISTFSVDIQCLVQFVWRIWISRFHWIFHKNVVELIPWKMLDMDSHFWLAFPSHPRIVFISLAGSLSR
jgi:hypothetical protein